VKRILTDEGPSTLATQFAATYRARVAPRNFTAMVGAVAVVALALAAMISKTPLIHHFVPVGHLLTSCAFFEFAPLSAALVVAAVLCHATSSVTVLSKMRRHASRQTAC
jgi:hypothetical protein